MRLSWSGHGTECYWHPPVERGGARPGPLAQFLDRVVPFVVAEVVVCVLGHCFFSPIINNKAGGAYCHSSHPL